MLRILALSIFVLLLISGPTQAAITRLTPNPTAPIKVDTTNPRYFTYGGKTIALVGISGEFLPHVNWSKPGAPGSPKPAENCGMHTVGAVKKYIRCIDQLYAAGLNVMRIWVNMNHSPGRADGDDKPYDFEQPYVYNPLTKKWDLNTFDANFERNLYTVVKYAQDKGVIVELTLFNPFVDDMSKSPWLAANHTALNPLTGDPCPNTTNAQFSNHSTFVRGDKPTSYIFPTAPFPAWSTQKDATFIDTACANAKLRRHQVLFIRRMVDLLNGRLSKVAPYNQRLHNFYWELANEPDGSAANLQQMMNWHYFMAWQLREYEKSLYPASYHLIAVNYAVQPLFEDLLTKTNLRNYVDIAAAHYVRKGAVSTSAMTNNEPPEETGDPGTPPEEGQLFFELPGEGGEGTTGEEPNGGGGSVTAATQPALGAIDMIRTYNKYDAVNIAKNNKVWAFNEGRITGFSVTPQTPNPATAASARAEAWEFMIAGGGVYDNMSFNWANLSGNATSAEHTRADLGRLYSFIGDTTFDLKNAKRDETWITSPMPYPAANPAGTAAAKFFAMMRNTDTFLLYRHNSRFSSHSLAGKYDPVITTGGYTDSVTFKNPYNCAATFTAEWVTTKAAHNEAGPNGNVPDHTQQPVSAPFTIAKNGTKVLTSQPYNYDILLRVKKTALGAGCTAGQSMINSANPAEGVTVTASSELNELHPASSVIDGDRTGADFGNGGGWMDATPAEYPDWIQLNYTHTRAINAVDIYTLRDDYLSGLEPAEEETFSLYGTTDLELQYRDVATGEWVSVPNAVLAGNDKVLMKFRFDTLFTDAIRVVVHNGLADQSRIVEIETFNIEEPPGGGEDPPEETM